ncbi:MAG TPA: T9SS type A sorting domain-containing protein [Vicingaceae bacterium]|nr:T9SS type A sorting domain-containing protein [Vicingaceae bacterium]
MQILTKIFLPIFILLNTIFAQPVSETVSMQAQYQQQVFYSLENGIIKSESATNWEIAFAVSGNGAAGSAILLNEANTTLWNYPGDTSQWNTFDTTNYNTWERLLNTDTSWTNGAFNVYRGANGMFDMGWGILNPQNNFWTFGDSLYLVKLANNSFKKLWIVSLKSGVWEFKYANIDGSNEQTTTFNKNNYPNRNFVYFSMINNQLIDREPDNTTWELTFVKHTDYVFPPGMYVPVSSIFSNVNVWSAKGHYTDLATANAATSPQTTFTKNINNIGREWKNYSSANGWEVYDTIAYFVHNLDSTKLFRIVFTGFGGMANGDTYFDMEEIVTSSVDEQLSFIDFEFYPNPASENINIRISNNVNHLQANILDITGKTLKTSLLKNTLSELYVGDLPSGMYLLQLLTDKQQITKKLIIK